MSGSTNALNYLKPVNDDADFPPPIPLLGNHKKPEFPMESLPQCIRHAVEEVGDYVQAPIPLIVSCVLGIAASIAQGLIMVRRDSQLVSPVSLIVISIAEPNERKSFIESFFAPPIRYWEAEQAKLTAEAFNDYKAAMIAFDAIESRLTKDLKGADSHEVEELQRKLTDHLNNRPDKPLSPKLIQADSTKEASIKHLAEKYPMVGIISAEGGTVLGGNSLSQSSVVSPLAFFNSMWSNESYSVDRSGDGETRLANVSLTMSIAVQPDVVGKFLDKNDQMARGIGFFARSLLCYPESTQGKRLYREAPESFPAVDAMNETLSLLLRMLPERIEGRRLNRKQVILSAEAKEEWIDYYNKVEQAQLQGSAFEFVRDVAGKSADNATRIAAILHLIDSENPHVIGDEVSAEHMRSGAAIAGYYLKEALAYFSKTDQSELIQIAQMISEKLASYLIKRRNDPSEVKGQLRWNEITKRDIEKMLGRKRAKLNSINPLLDTLTEVNHLIDQHDGGRNDSLVLVINPRLPEVVKR